MCNFDDGVSRRLLEDRVEDSPKVLRFSIDINSSVSGSAGLVLSLLWRGYLRDRSRYVKGRGYFLEVGRAKSRKTRLMVVDDL